MLQQSSGLEGSRVLMHKSFKHGFLRLAADHSVDPTKSLQAAELEDGDHLTAIAIQPKLAATDRRTDLLRCFALEVTASRAGGIHFWVVTALKSKLSSKVSTRFKRSFSPSFELPR